MKIDIDKTWDGQSIGDSEVVSVEASIRGEDLVVTVDAPFADDLPPSTQPGRTDRLWDHEVVELFFLGKDERYLEVELGPHGHYLVLLFEGVRKIKQRALLIDYRAVIEGRRWRGFAHIPRALLPEGVERGNAYAMRGFADARQYLAAFPVPGDAPDFHRIECFAPIDLS